VSRIPGSGATAVPSDRKRQGSSASVLAGILLTAITRERALLLVLPCDPFEQLFNGRDAVSRVFLDVIQRELVATVRQTSPPRCSPAVWAFVAL
jgi:hypothetical protein